MENNVEIRKEVASYLVKVTFITGESLPAIKEAIRLIGENNLIPVEMWYWTETDTHCVEFMCRENK